MRESVTIYFTCPADRKTCHLIFYGLAAITGFFFCLSGLVYLTLKADMETKLLFTFLTLVLYPYFFQWITERLRMRKWTGRLRKFMVHSIEVDAQHLRLTKENGALLVFDRKELELAILSFQEDEKTFFCLEIPSRIYTPRYFFLGVERDEAEALRNALELKIFKARAPASNAWGNWDTIPKELNTKRKHFSWGRPQRKKAMLDQANKQVAVIPYTQKKVGEEKFFFSCAWEPVEEGGWIFWFDPYSGGVAPIFGILGLLLLLKGLFIFFILCVAVLLFLFGLMSCVRKMSKRSFLFRVSWDDFRIQKDQNHVDIFGYASFLFYKDFHYGILKRFPSLKIMHRQKEAEPLEFPFTSAREKDLDELYHALILASDA